MEFSEHWEKNIRKGVPLRIRSVTWSKYRRDCCIQRGWLLRNNYRLTKRRLQIIKTWMLKKLKEKDTRFNMTGEYGLYTTIDIRNAWGE